MLLLGYSALAQSTSYAWKASKGDEFTTGCSWIGDNPRSVAESYIAQLNENPAANWSFGGWAPWSNTKSMYFKLKECIAGACYKQAGFYSFCLSGQALKKVYNGCHYGPFYECVGESECIDAQGNNVCYEENNPFGLEGDQGNRCEGMDGNPVNVTTGNKYQEEVDFVGQGVMPVSFVRYYNSQSKPTNDAPSDEGWLHSYTQMGDGWRHSYNYSLLEYWLGAYGAYSRYTIKNPSGNVHMFHKTTSASYTLPGDVFYKDFDVWRHDKKSGDTDYYDLTYGRLIKQVSRDGHYRTIEYNENGQLISVSNDLGKTLQFSYLDGRLISLTLPDLTVAYSGHSDH